ncbi:regulator of chromosome condensation 1/beta-lactamase-inhibitor protein II [Gamsiella multidivaricata]|uniref:regulator of chromosome condensation 1/beta-lactamase-inhibitor protein II n=1 Tax=Gamsiella multidivaricata TaxID=101098 RepID=UPI00221FED91|nr:regulator of chromosome condensation 1/beta-lactamase-inhibitor protein II [Gamsiella multidivaricata]KAI7826905.1 regulator of chromosome condensation 1/beta-lactamase-inhibitor protein II [Gamsiella multidivaricata]
MTVFESDSIIAQGPNKTRIAAGASHRLIALSGDGEAGVLGGGMNHSGQLGGGSRDNESTFSAIDTTGMEILAVACGREHSMLLAKEQDIDSADSKQSSEATASGASKKTMLFGFGNSMYGQLGLGGSKDTFGKELIGEQVAGFVFEPSPTQVQLLDPNENVVQVECGLDHTVLRTDQGNLYSMGWGADGQLGLGPESSSDRALPTLIERLSWKARGKEVGRIKEISTSTDFTLALLENHQIWIWGNAEYGQCMVNKKIDRILEPIHIPHPIPKTEVIASVAAGGTFGLLLTESGKVYTCGYGALGLGHDKIQILMPEQITALSGVRKIVASTDYAAAIDDKGDLYTWGTCGKTGRLGHGDFEHSYVPKRVKMPLEQDGRKVVVHDVALGQDGALAVVEYDDK